MLTEVESSFKYHVKCSILNEIIFFKSLKIMLLVPKKKHGCVPVMLAKGRTMMVKASACGLEGLTCDVSSLPHCACGFAAATVICRAWHYLCLCLVFSSEPLFSVTHHWLPNARVSYLLLLFFLATHVPALSLKLYFSVSLNKFSL